MKRAKEWLKRKYKGLKDYFLDRLKGYDTAPRFYKRYGARLGLDPHELLMRALEYLEAKKEEVWYTHRIFDRRQGASTTIGFMSYYVAAVRGKSVLLVVRDDITRRAMSREVLKYPGLDKLGKTYTHRLKIMTTYEVKRGKARGMRFDLCLIDRVSKDKTWHEALEVLRKEMFSGSIKRVIEFDQSAVI